MARPMTIRFQRSTAFADTDRAVVEIAGAAQPDRIRLNGTEVLEHQTLASFIAGDYSVRAQAFDSLGNAGDWSAPVTVQHRPQPPPPRNLRLVGNNLEWDWSDP